MWVAIRDMQLRPIEASKVSLHLRVINKLTKPLLHHKSNPLLKIPKV
jgi:hypothetical protein